MKTFTDKLKLLKESDDELIDQFAYNWPILDSIAGGLLVANGVTPPDAQLFDGCIVREATSGKVWIARKNPISGAYTKSWLSYPWMCCANSASLSIPSGTTYTSYAVGTFNAARSFNSSAADISGNQIYIPIDGIYEIQANATWTDADATDSMKAGMIRINGNNTRPEWNEDVQHCTGGQGLQNNMTETIYMLGVGSTGGPHYVGICVWQNSGVTRTVVLTLTVTMVTPYP